LPGGSDVRVGLSPGTVVSWHHAVYPAAPLSLPLLVPGIEGLESAGADEPRGVIAAVTTGPVVR
jgi:hypothetical protein